MKAVSAGLAKAMTLDPAVKAMLPLAVALASAPLEGEPEAEIV